MNKQDYIEALTKEIDKGNREPVKKEIFDHIEASSEFFEKIGYDSEAADCKAVECMGEYEAVSQQLAAVHNSSKASLIFALTAATAFLSYCIFCTSSHYCDSGNEHFWFSFAKLSLGYAVLLIHSLWGMKLKSRLCVVLAPLGAAVMLFCSGTVNAIFSIGGQLGIYDTEAYSKNYYHCMDIAEYITYGAIALAVIPLAANLIFTIIYCNKIAEFKNSKRDLRTRNTLYGITITLAIVNLVITALCGTLYANTLKGAESEYLKAIDTAVSIEMQAQGKKADELLKPYNIEGWGWAFSNKESSIDSGYYKAADYDNALLSIQYDAPQDTEYPQSKTGFYKIRVTPNCYAVDFMGLKLYSAFEINNQQKNELEEFAKSDAGGYTKQEIIDYLIKHRPLTVVIDINDTGSSYGFGYRDSKSGWHYGCSMLIYAEFDQYGQLKEITCS